MGGYGVGDMGADRLQIPFSCGHGGRRISDGVECLLLLIGGVKET